MLVRLNQIVLNKVKDSLAKGTDLEAAALAAENDLCDAINDDIRLAPERGCARDVFQARLNDSWKYQAVYLSDAQGMVDYISRSSRTLLGNLYNMPPRQQQLMVETFGQLLTWPDIGEIAAAEAKKLGTRYQDVTDAAWVSLSKALRDKPDTPTAEALLGSLQKQYRAPAKDSIPPPALLQVYREMAAQLDGRDEMGQTALIHGRGKQAREELAKRPSYGRWALYGLWTTGALALIFRRRKSR